MIFVLHIAALLFVAVVIILADKDAMAWMRGKKETLDMRRLRMHHGLTWAALIVLILSGLWMAWPALGYYFSQPLFIIKMLFVAILVINAFIIGRLSPIAAQKSFASLSRQERLPLYASGAISTFAWVATVLAALTFFA